MSRPYLWILDALVWCIWCNWPWCWLLEGSTIAGGVGFDGAVLLVVLGGLLHQPPLITIQDWLIFWAQCLALSAREIFFAFVRAFHRQYLFVILQNRIGIFVIFWQRLLHSAAGASGASLHAFLALCAIAYLCYWCFANGFSRSWCSLLRLLAWSISAAGGQSLWSCHRLFLWIAIRRFCMLSELTLLDDSLSDCLLVLVLELWLLRGLRLVILILGLALKSIWIVA